jgi:hypothetical protein
MFTPSRLGEKPKKAAEGKGAVLGLFRQVGGTLSRKSTHNYYTNDELPSCAQGLGVCRVCGAYEGGLATDCPGYHLSSREQQRIYAGTLDFKDGRWVVQRVKGQIIRINSLLALPDVPLNACDPWREVVT